MKKITFLTCAKMQDFVSDDQLCQSHFEKLGYELIEKDWRSLRDDDFETSAMILRTTWDYLHYPDEFLATLHTISSSGVPLFNSYEMVNWNLKKTYLSELQKHGIPLPPTFFFQLQSDERLGSLIDSRPEISQWVLKPQVSLNAYKTFWITSQSSLSEAFHELKGENVILQAFLTEVLDPGEISLFFFNGKYSHAVRKQPASGDFRVQEEHGGRISRHDPSDKEIHVARTTLSCLSEVPLYARVDLIPTSTGPMLMELELIEPALYLRFDPEAPARLVKAILERLK